MVEHEPWDLAVDFGTTYTAAAALRQGNVEVVEVDGRTRMPSCVVHVDGTLIVGVAAERQRLLFPDRTEPTPKRHLGIRERILLGGQPVEVRDTVAAVIKAIHDEAIRRNGSTAPQGVLLTHPARWGSERRDALLAAADLAGFSNVALLAEPIAAALHFADELIAVGDHVAVYDFGGGTFDTAVLQRTSDGFLVAGPPGGDERLGGEDLDRRLFDFVIAQIAAEDPDTAENLRASAESVWQVAAAELLVEARIAKEALSRHSRHYIRVPQPAPRQLLITRPEFEALIRTDILATVDEFVRTIAAAGLRPSDVSARYLTGGSSRIPLVSRMIEEAFDRTPDTYDDPKVAVALGAAKSFRRTITTTSLVASAGRAEVEASPRAEPAVLPRVHKSDDKSLSRVAVAVGAVAIVLLAAAGIAAGVFLSARSPGPMNDEISGQLSDQDALAVGEVSGAGTTLQVAPDTSTPTAQSVNTVGVPVQDRTAPDPVPASTGAPTTAAVAPTTAAVAPTTAGPAPTTTAVLTTVAPTPPGIVGPATIALFDEGSFCAAADLGSFAGGWEWRLIDHTTGITAYDYGLCAVVVCDINGLNTIELETFRSETESVGTSSKQITCSG